MECRLQNNPTFSGYIGFAVKYRIRSRRYWTKWFSWNGFQSFFRRWSGTLFRWNLMRCRWYLLWVTARGHSTSCSFGCWTLWTYNDGCFYFPRECIFVPHTRRSMRNGNRKVESEVEIICCMVTHFLVFGRIRLLLIWQPPSRTCKAVRSFGEICLNPGLGFFTGDVNDFIFSFSMSKRIFSFRLRRSSSFQSFIRLGRLGSTQEKRIKNTD